LCIDLGLAEGHDIGILAGDHLLLVLLPGLDGTGKLFKSFVAALGTKVNTQIVAYPIDEPLGYAELETLVRAELPTDRRYVLLGESFSGPLAIRIAADPPAGLVGVILCVTFAKNPQPLLAWTRPWTAAMPVKGLASWVRAPFMGGGWSSNLALDEVELAAAAVDDVVLRHRIAAVLAVDETIALARIRIPTLILQATDDHVVPRAASEHMLLTLPSAELIEVDGPHLLLQSRPAECAVVILRFLKAL
jgi:pimeloyl-[acyl-carrier protein] methyl ester esterase